MGMRQYMYNLTTLLCLILCKIIFVLISCDCCQIGRMLSNPSLIRAVTAGTPLAGSSALQGEDAVYHNFSCEIQWNLSQANTIGACWLQGGVCVSDVFPVGTTMCTHATKGMLPELSVLLYGVCTGEKGYNKLEYCQVVTYYFTAS